MRPVLLLATGMLLGLAGMGAGTASAAPAMPARGVVAADPVDQVRAQRGRVRHTPQRVMGLVPGPDRRRGSMRSRLRTR